MPFKHLNELEVLEIAKGIEEVGYSFYKSLYEKFKDESLKKMFDYLASEEKEHIKTFERLSKKVMDKQRDQQDYIYDEMTTDYLKAISDTAVFHKDRLEDLIHKVQGLEDALILGLQAEKDAILFYETILKHTQFEETKKVLKRLVREEVKHLHKFKSLLDTIPKNQ